MNFLQSWQCSVASGSNMAATSHIGTMELLKCCPHAQGTEFFISINLTVNSHMQLVATTLESTHLEDYPFRSFQVTGHIRGCIQSNPNKKLERKMTSTILMPELLPINPTQATALETPPKFHLEGTMACQFSSWILSFLNQRVLLPLFLVVSVHRNWPSYKHNVLGN